MLKINSGIIFALIFSVIMIVSINIRNHITTKNCDSLSSGENLTDKVLNTLLTDISQENILFKDLLSEHEYTWVFFFSPQCPSCRIISRNISSNTHEQLIGFSLNATPFSSFYKRNIISGIPVFRVQPSQASVIGICSVPYLIKIDRQGEILEAISSYKPVLKKIREL